MPAAIALLLVWIAVLLIGAGVFFTGAAQTLIARKRSAAVGVPLVATGVGFFIVLAAGIALALHAGTHVTSTEKTFVVIVR